MIQKKIVHVYGEPTVDWLSIAPQDASPQGTFLTSSNTEGDQPHLSSQPGGSALLHKLLRKMVPPEKGEIYGYHVDEQLLKNPFETQINRVWTSWKNYSQASEEAIYRIASRGRGEYDKHSYSGFSETFKRQPNLVIIDATNLGFDKEDENTAGWPRLLKVTNGKEGYNNGLEIIVKIAHKGTRISENGNWSCVLNAIKDRNYGKNTTLVVPINELRACGAEIGISLSWERIFSDIVKAVYSKKCEFLGEKDDIFVKRVIVTIGTSGAVIIQSNKTESTNTTTACKNTSSYNYLIFDRFGQEGDFERARDGRVLGYATCVIAALATVWIETGDDMDWPKATKVGLGLARLLHHLGYEISGHVRSRRLQFPYKRIEEAYYKQLLPTTTPTEQNRTSYADDPIHSDIWQLGIFEDTKDKTRERLKNSGSGGVTSNRWDILNEVLRASCDDNAQFDEEELKIAKTIVRKGPQSALPNVPIETVQKWRSADRGEIEGVRSVKNAIKDYLFQLRTEKGKNVTNPLSVAVFGPPGAGKSFAVKQIAKDLEIPEEAQLTFNLSQFYSPSELGRAFHRIRDLHLAGNTPLVFWDEFDTALDDRPLGWLRYFLAPMQDRQFSFEGELRPIGSGIYVFAGGTYESFEDFRKETKKNGRSVANSLKEGSEEQNQNIKNAKKPDFTSRLRAFVDVKGLNPDGKCNKYNRARDDNQRNDPYMIRRAFLLHSLLNKYERDLTKGSLFQIDSEVLDFFLCGNTRFRHGARSMEALIDLSALTGRSSFDVSSLPPSHLREMHVEINEKCLAHSSSVENSCWKSNRLRFL